MSPALLSHPIPILWHPQDVPKEERHVWAPFSWDTSILIPAHGCFSNDMATLLLGCGHPSAEVGLKLLSRVVFLGQTSP